MPRVAARSPVKPVNYQPMFTAEDADRFSAAEVRQAIAYWVGQDKLDVADALVAAGVAMYPNSEDILAIGALVAEVNQDWAQAQDCLEKLIEIQGDAAAAECWHHLVRVLRCRSSYFQAFIKAGIAVKAFPAHQGLRQAHAELTQLMESVPAQVTIEAQAV